MIPRAPALPQVDAPAAVENMQVNDEPSPAGEGATVAAPKVVAVKQRAAKAEATTAHVHRVKRGDTLLSLIHI